MKKDLRSRVFANQGFTLVEIAIVLVLIGIILGAVLKGGDLIDNAKEKQFKSEISSFTTAYYNYLDKYGRVPGDDNTATLRWATATNGGNNGLIDAAGELAPATGTLDHLRWAALIPGATGGAIFSSAVYNGVTINFGSDASTPPRFGKASNYLEITTLSAADKLAYDTKYDDGDFSNGDVQSANDLAYAAQAMWIRIR